MNKVMDMLKNNRKIVIGLSIFIVILILIIVLLGRNKYKNTIDYVTISNYINNKETFLIYYYNSKSGNKNNKNVKKYLDSLGIRYYGYNDVYIDREEYNSFVELIKIDKNSLGVPALIYIKDGVMYGNIINIDSNNVVDKFIEAYDLYHVK